MRTTIRLNDELLKEAKQYAAKHQRSLTSVIEDGLRIVLNQTSAQESTGWIEPIVDDGQGLNAGVNLSNNAEVRELMDVWDATPRR